MIVPCFNESERFNADYWTDITKKGILLVFVDDGSTDQTARILEVFCSTNDGSQVINLSENCGKANAIQEGLNWVFKLENSPKIAGFIDADGAFEVEDVLRLLEYSEEVFMSSIHAVWASRVKLLGSNIRRNEIRHRISRVIATFLSKHFSDFPYDSQCGLKFFLVNQQLRTAIVRKFETRWFFDLEIFIRLLTLNSDFKAIEVPLHSWKDVKGSKVNGKEIFRLLYEIPVIRRKSRTLHER